MAVTLNTGNRIPTTPSQVSTVAGTTNISEGKVTTPSSVTPVGELRSAAPARIVREIVPCGMKKLGTFDPGMREVNRGMPINAGFADFNPQKHDSDSPYKNGAIKIVSVDATPDGLSAKVDVFHSKENSLLTLLFCVEVLDKESGQLRNIVIDTPVVLENVNPDTADGKHSYESNLEFVASYPRINAWLQESNPNIMIVPGHTKASVAAVWSEMYLNKQEYTPDFGKEKPMSVHRAGGPNRGGAFVAPVPLTGGDGSAGVKRSALAVRAGGVASTTQARQAANPLPLDVAVQAPPELIKAFPNFLDENSVIESRREDEDKAGISIGSSLEDLCKPENRRVFLEAVTKAYDLAENPQKVAEILGDNWTLKPIDRYWLNTNGDLYFDANHKPQGTLARDADGFPKQDPMHDTYLDNEEHSLAAAGGGARRRENKSGTKYNFKPNGGCRNRADAPHKVERNELSWTMKPGVSEQDMGYFLKQLDAEYLNGNNNFFRSSVFNTVNREIRNTTGKSASEMMNPWLDVTQNRHKFCAKDKETGIEIEFSIDEVVATLRNPKPGQPSTVTFWVIESELDHMQMKSKNQTSFQMPKDVASFDNNDQQVNWLNKTSRNEGMVTTVIEPRLHEVADLSKPVPGNEEGQDRFVDATARLKHYLFGGQNLCRSEQKSVLAGRIFGVIPAE